MINLLKVVVNTYRYTKYSFTFSCFLIHFFCRFIGVPMFSTSWITMLSCEVRRQDKEDRLRQELQKFQSGQNVKLNAKTRLKFYQFLKPEGKFNIKGFISFASVSGLLHSRFYKIGKTEKGGYKRKCMQFLGKNFSKVYL